jgi:hypothetical protein
MRLDGIGLKVELAFRPALAEFLYHSNQIEAN